MRFEIETALIAVQAALEGLEFYTVGTISGGIPNLVFPAIKIIIFRFIIAAHHNPKHPYVKKQQRILYIVNDK
jgi:hypothetical protein